MRAAEVIALKMDKGVFDAMVAAARQAAPLEACGLLGGRRGQATEFCELRNADASGEHYRMLPEEQFAAVKGFRAKGLAMTAIWHSHPATPASMSSEDLRLAYTPDVVYILLSLASAVQPEMRGFTVEEGTPREVAITVLEHLTC